MGIVLSWLILSVAVWITARVVPGFELKGGAGGALTVAALFGVLEWLLGKALFAVLVVGTLGLGYLLAFLTRLVVGAILLKVTDALTERLTIRSWGTALFAAALMSFLGTAGEALVKMAH